MTFPSENTGLTAQTLALITAVLEKTQGVSRAALFGSRAKGTFRANSDIDLVVWGEVSPQQLAHLHAELDELSLPYLFDIKHYPAITSSALKEEIDACSRDVFIR